MVIFSKALKAEKYSSENKVKGDEMGGIKRNIQLTWWHQQRKSHVNTKPCKEL